MIHTYCPLPRTEMAPAMLVIILKVVRLRNHQILAKDPRVNQAGRPEANLETMRMKAKNCHFHRKIPICITLFSIPTGEWLYEERGKNTVYYPAYTSFTKSGYAFLGWRTRKPRRRFFIPTAHHLAAVFNILPSPTEPTEHLTLLTIRDMLRHP